MKLPQFQLHKVKRLIAIQGSRFEFRHLSVDSFGEPDGSYTSAIVTGVFHETTSHVSRSVSDSSTTHSKASSNIMTTWEEAQRVATGDHLIFNSHKYIVCGITNVDESNVIGDISLEEVLWD